jgi:hypothetical protein
VSARRRGFLLLAALAIAAAMPAFAQTVAPAAGPAAGGTQNAVSIPDLSGIWAHPLPYRLRAAAVGSRPGEEQVAAAQWRGQLPEAGRRLRQSDLEAPRR